MDPNTATTPISFEFFPPRETDGKDSSLEPQGSLPDLIPNISQSPMAQAAPPEKVPSKLLPT